MSLCLSAALGYLTGRNVSANAIGALRGCTVPHSHAFWLFLEPRLFWFAVKCQYCFCISSPPIKWHVPLQPDDIALLKLYACINIRAAEEKCLRSRGSMHQSANLLTLKMEGSEVQSPAAGEITEHMWAYVCVRGSVGVISFRAPSNTEDMALSLNCPLNGLYSRRGERLQEERRKTCAPRKEHSGLNSM